MWTYPAWHLWMAAEPARPRISGTEKVLARVRHPSFTPAIADELVRGLSRPALRRLWAETGRLLEGTRDDDERLHVVVLRQALLERLDPIPDREDAPHGE